MDAIVQLLRNACCCIKDLELLKSHAWLWDAKHTQLYYDFPSPLEKTTRLEALISLSQLYVVITGTLQAITLMSHSLGKLRRVERVMKTRRPVVTSSDQLLNASLVEHGVIALRQLVTAQCLLFLSISFIWLVANSWHVTETNWIGGLPALIHALTVMEVCLVPLLYFMYRQGKQWLQRAEQMNILAQQLSHGDAPPTPLSLSTLEILFPDWQPFWAKSVSLLEPVDTSYEAKCLEQESNRINQMLQTVQPKSRHEKDTAPDYQDWAETIRAHSYETRTKGYRELVYFLINLIAFYGYGMSIVAYYLHEHTDETDLKEGTIPGWIRQYALFGLSNTQADWHGNFAGDLMWTIEPIIIITSPWLLRMAARSKDSRKKKTN